MEIKTSRAQLKYNLTKKAGRSITHIVLHYTATDGSAENNCIYFGNGNRNASADYFVDKDGTIWQFNADIANYYSWHCGCSSKYTRYVTNAQSIGIEVVGTGSPYTDAQKAALRELVPWLMSKYGVSADNVVRHYDCNSVRKLCPYAYCGTAAKDDAWAELKAYVTGGAASAPTNSEPSSGASSSSQTGGLSVDGLWGKATTTALQKALGTTADGIVSNQYSCYKAQNPGLLSSSWSWKSIPGKNGSPMVKALQSKLGVKADGFIGPNTIKKLQTHLGTGADGCVSKPSPMVKELQRRLNAGTF